MASRRYFSVAKSATRAVMAEQGKPHQSDDPVSAGRHSLWDRVRHQDLLLAAVMLVLLVLLQSPAQADEETYRDLAQVGTGTLLEARDGEFVAMLRLDSDVALTVSGMVVQAEIKQRFRNDTADWVEATYVFPLPSNSAVNRMRIAIGDRMVEGVIREKHQAQALFVKAREEGKQAGLLEQQRPNLFTTRVTNIAPGATVVVDFAYLQPLAYEQAEFSVRIPLTLTPRYIPGWVPADPGSEHAAAFTAPVLSSSGWGFATDQVPDAPAITPPQVPQSVVPGSHHATVSLRLNPGFELAEVTSPFHQIRVTRQADGYWVEPQDNPVVMNRDLVVRWRPVASRAPTAAVFLQDKALAAQNASLALDAAQGQSEGVSEGGRPTEPQQHQGAAKHALLMVMPPQQVFAELIPPRELVIVIDTSGSMSGASITQAKAAVTLALDRLRPGDRFNVIEFNSGYRQLFAQPQMAEQRWLEQARRFVKQLRADGGTEMAGALAAALAGPQDEGFLRQVVFITDGSVGNERALFELIHQQLGNSRLYTVGIGAAPNEFFMRKAAEFGKGTFAMIGGQQQVQQEMSVLFDRIEKPVLTDLRVSLEGGAQGDTANNHMTAEWFPRAIPDLYAGQPLVIHGRFSEWPDSVLLEGQFAGQHWQQRVRISARLAQGSSPGVATLWAREKVQWLEDEATRQGQRDRYQMAIQSLGLEYGIVTRFTSFVAVSRDVVRDATDALTQKTLPNLMPEGSTQTPPSVGMPPTALGIHHHVLLGAVSLLFALLLACLKYGCHFTAIRFPSAQESVS